MVRSGGGEGIQAFSLAKGNFLQVISEHYPERRRVLWSSGVSDSRIQSLVLALWPWPQMNL